MAFSKCIELTDVICYSTNVPSTMATDAFDGSLVEYATLYVPESSLNDYKNTLPWSGFGAILPINPMAIEELKNVDTSKTTDNTKLYDLMGRRLQQKPASGYYIQGGKKFFVK